MDKYKKLFSNTIVFAIGTFSSKILTILLTPFITRALNTGEYGVMDIIQQTVNVLVPLATLAVNSAALRFAMDKAEDKRAVFSTGVTVTGIGYAVFLCFTPLLSGLSINEVHIGDYIILIAVFLLSSSTRQLCQQFVRGMGWVRLYAIDGILATFTNLVCNVLYLGVFKWGMEGAILAIATSDLISIIFLTVLGRLDRFIRIRRLKKRVIESMLRYCIPLVPTALLWLIINISNRYMVLGFMGASASGLYAVASKIPNFVLLFAGIFIDAWQLSSVDEYGSESRGHFFTKVFKIYSGALFVVGSGLILLCQPFTRILVDPDYYESWQYVPILIISTIFSCLVNFLASVYMAEKKNTMSMATALAGAVISVGLNLLLIPKIGIYGAAIATLCSFLLVFVLRAIDTKRFVKIRFSALQMVVNLVILGTQSALMLFWDRISTSQILLYGIEVVLTLAMVIINGKPLVEIVTLLAGRFLKKKGRGSAGKNRSDAPSSRPPAQAAPNRGMEPPVRRTPEAESMPKSFETLAETINNGEDYLGLGFKLSELTGGTEEDAEPPPPPYQIKYEDAFAGDYLDLAPPEPARGNTSDRQAHENKGADADDTYFGERSTGFIRKRSSRNSSDLRNHPKK